MAILIALTIGLPWLGALVLAFTGDRRPRAQHTFAVLFSVAAGLCALAMLPSVFGAAPETLSLEAGGVFGSFSFRADGLSVFLAAVATVIGSLAVVFSIDYMRGEEQLGRYYAFVLLFIGSMAGLVLTTSLLLLFVFWEMTALCSYALISFHNDDPKAVKGGIKALLITGLGGIGLFVAALAAQAYLHTYDIDAFIKEAQAPALMPREMITALAFCVLAAAAAKSAQFPFHTWLPDAMEAPTPISALIHAATMVNAGVYVLARFYEAFKDVPNWAAAVMAVGFVTALMAAVMALVANDLKRVLAYSTVSQLGYMVYAIGVGGLFASQFHLLSHAVFKALLFLGAGAVIHAVGTRDMREMGGLGRQMPFTRNVFVIGALALAGIPILNGFWSKELVLEAGALHGPLWAYGGMLLGAGITALYTLRMLSMVFFGQPHGMHHVHDAGPAMKVSLSLLAAGTLTTWLLAGPFAALLGHGLAEIEAEETGALLTRVVTAPETWLALAVVALGLAAWWGRARLAAPANALRGVAQAAAASFGFEWINRVVVAATQGIAEGLRVTQTGVLNWNVAGIIGGLLVVLAILTIGSIR